MRTLVLILLLAGTAAADERPNILWLTSEDNGPQLGCYGDAYADTPNLDRLATDSLRYRMCWSNAPVCAPARTTLITGMYATTIGGQNMRSAAKIPADVVLYPNLFRAAGYYCTNHTKTDYNLVQDDVGWNDSSGKAHWRNRASGQPFFAVYNSTKSHESQIRRKPHTLVHNPADAPLPAYHPDTPEVRRDWAQYYDVVTEMDAELGKVLAQLRADGLENDTIIFYYGDHGSGMPRSKRWPFNSGLQVPFLLHIPDKFASLRPDDYESGGVSDRLVSFVDMPPTALSLCGIEPPKIMAGTAIAGPFAGPAKEFLFGFRDRMDERIDMARSCTDGRYVYLKQFYPDRSYLPYLEYMYQTPTTRVWKEMFDAGTLNQVQARYFENKPVEELFDLQADPDEINNLASDPQHAERLATMRKATMQWMIDAGDTSVLTEHDLNARSGEGGPLELMRSGKVDVKALVPLAFAATSRQMSTDDLIAKSRDDNRDIRYWATRGLALLENKTADVTEALSKRMQDESVSVSIAAAAGLLSADDSDLEMAAIDRLISHADVSVTSHWAALAALNALDLHATLTSEQLERIAKLNQANVPTPPRTGEYLGDLTTWILAKNRQTN